MRLGTGEYRGGKYGGYARVHVRCDNTNVELCVNLALDDHTANEQLRDGSFIDWTNAAIAGVTFALSVTEETTGSWTVHRIVGLLVDTVPRFVAIAAARSVWNALCIEPTASLDDELMRFVDDRYPK